MSKKKILVTFDSMQYPNTGFFYFGKSLSHALVKQNDNTADIFIYTHPKVKRNILPQKVPLINKSVLHKIFFLHRFDLVHFSDQYCHPHPSLVRGKKILTLHDVNPLYELREKPAKLKRYIKKIKNYIRLFDHIVAISNFVKAEVIKHFPEIEEKISVIYNGADKLTPADINHQPVYKPYKPFLFTIGILSPKKNFHVLPALLQNNDYELVIAGIIKEDYKNLILQEALKYNCSDRIQIIGTISDIDKAWYYENCLAFMFPSLSEGFGLPIIEAMHFGKPVFLSDLTSLPEIGGEEAFYFRNFEANHMNDVFEKGMKRFKNYSMEPLIKANAKRFSWEETATSYLELYNTFN